MKKSGIRTLYLYHFNIVFVLFTRKRGVSAVKFEIPAIITSCAQQKRTHKRVKSVFKLLVVKERAYEPRLSKKTSLKDTRRINDNFIIKILQCSTFHIFSICLLLVINDPHTSNQQLSS